jgi:hypothetical protein
MTVVVLDAAEMLLAANAGIMRHIENVKKGAKPAYGAGNQNDWQIGIEGAICEFVLAKHLGVFWHGKGKMRGDDAGPYQVRGSQKKNACLILHPEDNDDKIYYLVTGYNGIYRVCGYVLGKDGKQQKYWKDPAGGRPAFFIPQSDLKTN